MMKEPRYIVKAEEMEYTKGTLAGKIFFTFYYNRNKAVVKESTDKLTDDQKAFLHEHNVVNTEVIGTYTRKTIA